MNHRRCTLKILTVLFFTLTCASLAQAQATRTWVSGVGDDVNPCSRTAPCKTFAGAISKTAAGGEINAIDPGGFGAVTITKSLTIDGGGTFASILAAGTNGVVVNDALSGTPGGSIVTLRNLSINGAGTGTNGIRFLRGRQLTVQNVEIFNFTGNGIDAQLSGAASTGNIFAFFDDVNIRDLKGVGSIGIKLTAPATFLAGMDHVRVERVPTAVQVSSNVAATIRDSVLTHNGIGVEMVNGTTALATIENTMLTDNTTGISAGGSTRTRISQVSIIACTTAISNGGGAVLSSGNNRLLDNSIPGLTPTIVNPQ